MNTGDDALADVFRRHSQESLPPYHDFAQRVRTALNAESCALFLVHHQAEGASVLELAGEDCDSGFRGDSVRLPIRSKKGAGLTSHLAHANRIIRLHGSAIRKNPYLAGNKALHLKSGTDYSLLSVPIKNRKDQLLGLLKVQNKKGTDGRVKSRGRFSQADVSLAAFLANRLGIVVEGRRFVAFLRALLQEGTSPDSLYAFETETIAHALSLVGADRGSLALWDDEQKALIISARVGVGSPGPGNPIPKRSVMQTVWTRRESICIADVKKYKGAYYRATSKTRSEVAVLVRARDGKDSRPLGVLNAESSSKARFDVQDQIMLEGLGETLGIVIASARPTTSLKEALASLSAPARVFVEPKKLLASILERVRVTYGFDCGIIYVTEEMSNVLRLGAQMGCNYQQHLVGAYTHELNKGSLAALVARTGVPVFSEDPKSDSRVFKEGLVLFRIEGPLLGLPLVHSGKTVGVLICWSSAGPRPRHEHLRELAPFAQVAAAEIAISHAYALLDEWIHNIAQPSQNVRGLVQMIRRIEGQEKKRELMTILKSEAEHLVSVVERSRLVREHQRVPPVRNIYCLKAVVKNLAHVFGQMAKEKSVMILLNLPEEPCCPVYGDKNRVTIALQELVNNAVKHSKGGDRVTLRLTRGNAVYEIEVIDEGDGVSQAHAKYIFLPYFSLRPGGGRAGTGLGLTIASGIIVEEGGSLTCSSGGPHLGCVFTVHLPVETHT